MNITLIDGLHDSDRGGAGIIEGAINTIEESLPDSKPRDLALVYRTSANTSQASTAARHTRKSFPKLQIYYSPYNKNRSHRRFIKLIQGIRSFCGGLALLALPRISSHPTVQRLKSSDIIFSKGGHFYHSLGQSKWSPLGGPTEFISMYLIILCLRLGKPVVLLGHSIGPYPNIFARFLAKLVFQRMKYIGVREAISADQLRSMGVKQNKIYVIPDTAFAMRYKAYRASSMHISVAQPGPVVAITARQWHFPESSRNPNDADRQYSRYINALASAADQLIACNNATHIILVAHNDGDHDHHEIDSVPAEQIRNAMNYKSAVTIVDEDLSPSQLCELYGSCDLLIGTRMHSVIFALLGGSPVVALSYTHKTDGIMQMFNINKYQLSVTSMNPEQIVEKAISAICEKERILLDFNRILEQQLLALRAFVLRSLAQAGLQ